MTDLLLIEDNESVRNVVRQMLERLGHSVRCAGDGVEGVSMFKQEGTNLVITDMMMPEMEGLETIHELRGIQPQVKILAISGGWRSMEAETCLKLASGLGADATLQKPFTLAQLKQAVAQLVEV